MVNHYKSLQDLLQAEPRAKEYFVSLPDYVRGMIEQRSGNVNSLDSLQDYAENLLRGDD